MLQRSSLPTASTAELADTLGQSLGRSLGGRARLGAGLDTRWRALQNWLPLPATWQQYLLACLALTIVFGGMLLHVLLSVQIARADFQLRQMQAEYARIERQNSELIYQIAQRSSLAQMATLAAEQGYVPATGRTYVLRSSPAYLDPVSGSIAAPDLARGPAQSPTAASTAAPTAAPAITPAVRTASGPPAGSPAGPARWLEQTAGWWQEAQQAAGAATAQFWRDITGRVE